jgi:hypothetical protein
MTVKVSAAGTHVEWSLWQKSILLLGGDSRDFGLESGLMQLLNTALWKCNQELVAEHWKKLLLLQGKSGNLTVRNTHHDLSDAREAIKLRKQLSETH